MVYILTDDYINEHKDTYDLEKNNRGAFYRSETKYIAQMVGGERGDKKDFFTALTYINNTSHLGLDDFEIEVLGRILTELGRHHRFVGDDTINVFWGENPATHSLQSINILEYVIHNYVKHKSQLTQGIADEQRFLDMADQHTKELTKIRQWAALGLVLHDMGEVLGEPRVLHGENLLAEDMDPTEFEGKVLEKVMALAIASVEEGERAGDLTSTRGSFYQNVRTMEAALGIEKRKLESTYRKITTNDLNAALKTMPTPALSETGQNRLDQLMAIWHFVEEPGKSHDTSNPNTKLPENIGFIGNFVKAIEHNQGMRHITRFALKEKKTEQQPNSTLGRAARNPYVAAAITFFKQSLSKSKADSTGNGTQSLSDMPLERIAKTLRFAERDLPPLFESANTDIEHGLAVTQKEFLYASTIAYLNEAMKPYDVTAEYGIATASPNEGGTGAKKLSLQERLMTLYEAAIEDQEFAPTTKSIGADWIEKDLTPESLLTFSEQESAKADRSPQQSKDAPGWAANILKARQRDAESIRAA